jgi:uncharacterized iron-regulated membrane protein
MKLRPVIFWAHLVCGVAVGTVVLIMAVTGTLLTFEKQMIAWADRSVLEAPTGTSRLPVDQLLFRIQEQAEGVAPASITVPAGPDVPVLALLRQRTVLVDPYSGALLGESAPRLRRFFRVVTDWHRWLAVGGSGRAAARAVTGWSNTVFLFIILSGAYLWLPRVWSWRHVRAVAWFNGKLSGKARDFNWHNVIGVWSLVPLFFVIVTAMPISFPWANALLYRAVGEAPPAAARPAAPGAASLPRSEAPAAHTRAQNLDAMAAAWRRAESQVPGWKTITLRIPPAADAPLTFTIDRGTAGQPQHRGTLTVHAATGEVVRWEPFAAQSLGRRVRSVSRFLHTGEVLGPVGQAIAGIASAGAAVLVWTGLALAWRRFFRKPARAPQVEREDVAA